MTMRLRFNLLFMLALLAVAGCGEKKATNAEEYVANEGAADKGTPVDPFAAGAALVKSNDCNTCHHKTNTLIGPAHTKVAEKYEFTEANVKLLAEKIMKGGSGVWGQIPMAAHVDLSESDAEAMARYVLSLDGEKEH
jgi:cytochrome c